MTEVKLPKLPPKWSYEFRVEQSNGVYKLFSIILNFENLKCDSAKIQVNPEHTTEQIATNFDETLQELAQSAWSKANPDEQWPIINSYRWAINENRDSRK